MVAHTHVDATVVIIPEIEVIPFKKIHPSVIISLTKDRPEGAMKLTPHGFSLFVRLLVYPLV